MYWLGTCILVIVFVSSYAACPHDDTNNLSEFTANNAAALGATWTIDTGVLLNTDIDVDYINIIDNGQLVLKPGRDFIIRVKGIRVLNDGKFIIGGNNDACRFTDKVQIILKGNRTATPGPEGDKFIAVKDNGTLNLNGAEKLSWTRLAATIDRYDSGDLDSGEYVHSKHSDFTTKTSRQGLAVLRFNSELQKVSYEAYDFYNPNNIDIEQNKVNAMKEYLEELNGGDIVGISIQNMWNCSSQTSLTALYDTLESVSGFNTGTLDLRQAHTLDAFSMVFVKGTNKRCQHLDKLIGKGSTKSECYIEHNGKKISAISVMVKGINWKSYVDFRILNTAKGFPWITVEDDISTLNIGDSILVTSTDYMFDHGEHKKIRDLDTANKRIQVDGEFTYRHVSVLEKGVAMRAEVALLTRNILITGEMSRDCPETNENCDMIGYDTVGGHMKFIESFSEIYVNSIALNNMGQMPVKGAYPIHFHMCGDVADKTAVIKDVSIWNSYSRCVTVHGTRGRSKTEIGVEVMNVVSYQIRGSCYFLEDGAEIWTLFQGNLGAEIAASDNGWHTADKKPAVFWITNPKVPIIGCVAAGSEGTGFWYLFPDLPVGPSTAQNVFDLKEARNSPLAVFESCVAHSNHKTGFNFDSILDDEHGNFSGCMNFKSLSDPHDPNSEWVWNYITRLTAYKNFDFNLWTRGGAFIFNQYSSSNQQPEVRNSVCIGRSENNHEEGDGYPDAVTGSKIKRYLGVVFYDGPIYIKNVYFDGFEKSASREYAAGALGFKPKNIFSSSAASAVNNFIIGCVDTVQGRCNRIFDGNIDDADHGFDHFSGDETAVFRDIDGSVSLCPDETFSGIMSIVKPEKFTYTSNCKYRANWKMYRCQELYAKIQVNPKGLTADDKKTFSDAGIMKRTRYDDKSDTAYENHNELGRKSEFIVVLGSNEYYYEFEYEYNMPPKVQLVGKGIERNKPVVVGLCLPGGVERADITLSSTSTKGLSYSDSDMREVDSLTDLRDSEQMNKYYIKGRNIYFKLNTIVPRKEGMGTQDTDHCSTGTCPSFTVTFNTDFTYDHNSRCFTPTQAELSTDVYLEGVTNLTCTFPAATQNPADLGWGAGELFADVNGGVGEWSAWNDCCFESGETVTTTRNRLCDNPIPYGAGSNCSQALEEEKACTTPCPVAASMSSWGLWSDCYCDAEAEGSSGARKRTRTLTPAQNFGVFLSSTADLVEYEKCVGLCQYT